MFWKSVIEGFVILTHWKIWIISILYIGVHIFFLWITITKIFKGHVFLVRIIGDFIIPGILTSLVVAFLLPIFLKLPLTGIKTLDITTLILQAIKIGIVATMVVALLGLLPIPLISPFITFLPGIRTFLQGIIVFVILSRPVIHQILTKVNIHGSVYPSFWTTIGFFVIAYIMTMISGWLIFLLISLLMRRTGLIFPLL